MNIASLLQATFGVTTSNSGKILVIASNLSPYIHAYHWDDVTGYGTKYAAPSTTPSNACQDVAFSPDGSVLVCCNGGGSKITAYHWDDITGFGTAYSAPASLPAGAATRIAFSPDGSCIAVTSGTTPFIEVYHWNNSTGFGAKYSNPSTLPLASGNCVTFSTDGKTIAVGTANYPPVIYPWDNTSGFGTKITNPSGLSTITNCLDIAFSPDGTVITVGGNSSSGSFLAAYQWSNTTGFGTIYTAPVNLVAVPRRIKFSPDGSTIFIAQSTSGYAATYPWNNTTGFGTKINTSTPGISYGCAVNPAGTMVAFSFVNGTGLSVYPWNGTTMGTKITDLVSGIGQGNSVIFK